MNDVGVRKGILNDLPLSLTTNYKFQLTLHPGKHRYVWVEENGRQLLGTFNNIGFKFMQATWQVSDDKNNDGVKMVVKS